MTNRNYRMRWCLGLVLALLAGFSQAENLYDENSFRSLVSDKRAHLPGDVLTIQIIENSSASKTADTTLQRSNRVGIQANANVHQHNLGLDLNNNFDGGGTIQHEGKLLAQITVTVTKVASNGDLLVSGEQLIEINSDKQKIRVEGRVRPLDISESNTVLSYRLADAKVSYIGDGDLTARQKPGLLSQLIAWLGF